MNVLIVEDETIAYEYLSELVVRVDPDIRIVGATESITQTVKWLRTHPAPDLILWIFICRTDWLFRFLIW